MEDTRKRHQYDTSEEDTVDVKRTRREEEEEEREEDGILAWLSADDQETVSQLMELLDKSDDTNTTTNTAKVRFIDDPYSASLIYDVSSSSSYVTINGNEESCGSSFSDSDSSVMASVDMGGIVRIGNGSGRQLMLGACASNNSFGDRTSFSLGLKQVEHGGAWGKSDGVARGVSVVAEEEIGLIDGCDAFGWDDQVLARFLGEDF